MPRGFVLPRIEHLSVEPQLASLAVLETVANVAILALAAEYPELASSDAHPRDPPELDVAVDLIELARAVDITIARYRRAVAQRREREREEAELLPF
jgi:hypothetical protein